MRVAVNLPASVGIDMLQGQVQHADLNSGTETSLTAKLQAAQQSLAHGNLRAAANKLAAFANEVRALKRTHILADDLADLWLFEVDNIRAALL